MVYVITYSISFTLLRKGLPETVTHLYRDPGFLHQLRAERDVARSWQHLHWIWFPVVPCSAFNFDATLLLGMGIEIYAVNPSLWLTVQFKQFKPFKVVVTIDDIPSLTTESGKMRDF